MSTLDNLRKEAKRWLKALRAGNANARARLDRASHRALATPGLRDIQLALAREHGHATWAAMVQAVAHEQGTAADTADYERLADDWSRAYESGELAALQRLNAHYGRTATWDDVRAEVWRRVRTVREAKGAATAFGIREARALVARDAGFGGWNTFAAALAAGTLRGSFYTIDALGTTIRPSRTPTSVEWDALIDVVSARRITAIDANGTMTDEALARIAELNHVTSLSLGGSRQLTDEGLRQVARMPQLEHLELSEYPGGRISDRGLEVLRYLRHLRRFDMAWQSAVTDEGVKNLRFCEAIESVDVMGTATGDRTLAALRGKANLQRLKTGRFVTDAGLEHLRDLPRFTTPFAGDASCTLMKPEAGPHHLMIDGPFTGRGLERLTVLGGLTSLSFFGHVSEITPRDLAPLTTLPNLHFFGCDGELCDDEAMRHIGAIPRLRMLMAQGAVATDDGFVTLARSRTLEYLWGRECPNLQSRGFAALARMPALRGLAVSCLRVGDSALAELPRSATLTDLLPMDVSDDGFRHVGQCAGLESLWCMYCRDTTDRATEHLIGLSRLKRYYAGASQITDRSLELLSRMPSLERVEIYECLGVTDQGLALLATLPNLREMALSGLPHVTQAGTAVFPSQVHVDYHP